MTTAAIIPAAGRGERLGASRPKAFVELGGRSLLEHALRALVDSRVIDLIVVAAPAAQIGEVEQILARTGLMGSISRLVVAGGSTRQASVAAALAVLPNDVDVVLVHDAARALAPADLVRRVEATVREGHQAVVPGMQVTDTVKKTEPGPSPHRVRVTIDRAGLWRIQTPQGFNRTALDAAHRYGAERADDEKIAATDDAGLIEVMGGEVVVIDGDEYALKITTPLDFAVAQAAFGETTAS